METLTRRQEALRYAIAALPVALYGSAWAWLVSQDITHGPQAVVDVGLGLIGIFLLRWRRARPFTVALLTSLLNLGSAAAIGAALVAFASLATRRNWPRTVGGGVVLVAAVVSGSVVQSGWGTATQVMLVGSVASTIAVAVAGLYLRSTRDLAKSEARRQEIERSVGLENARGSERARIAREMHDVLAHRLSLLSLHAGALAHRTDLSVLEIRAAAEVIRLNAHASLDELRSTLGSLRDDTLGPPQPSFADIPVLLSEVREAGQRVDYFSDLVDGDSLPPQVGRHVFRIVQETLTNARKHSPGSPVLVRLEGGPGSTIDVLIENGLTSATPASAGGLGLIGLGERAASVDGSLAYRRENGRFVVEASLPWEETW